MTRNEIAMPQGVISDGRHRYPVRVYYEDTDAGGIVYHATYLRFAERARTEALRDLGIPHAEMMERFNLMFVVRTLTIDYFKPARLDDSLTVETSAREVGGATILLRQDVAGPLGICATLSVRLACLHPGETRPGRIPPRWRATLSALRDAGRCDAGRYGAGQTAN